MEQPSLLPRLSPRSRDDFIASLVCYDDGSPMEMRTVQDASLSKLGVGYLFACTKGGCQVRYPTNRMGSVFALWGLKEPYFDKTGMKLVREDAPYTLPGNEAKRWFDAMTEEFSQGRPPGKFLVSRKDYVDRMRNEAGPDYVPPHLRDPSKRFFDVGNSWNSDINVADRNAWGTGWDWTSDRFIFSTDYPTTDLVADANDPLVRCTLPLKPESTDVMVSMQVLGHIPEPMIFLRESFRLLKRGGALYVSCEGATMPTHGEGPETYGHCGGYSVYGLEKMVGRAGFQSPITRPGEEATMPVAWRAGTLREACREYLEGRDSTGTELAPSKMVKDQMRALKAAATTVQHLSLVLGGEFWRLPPNIRRNRFGGDSLNTFGYAVK